jgi:pilus assembly protein CpaE
MAGENILFVDDEEQIRKLLSAWLTRHGYKVTLAADGLEALKAIRVKLPDLLITDVTMPNMTGLELTRQIRADHRTARMPIVMLSARKQANEVLSGYSEGADEYVAKPVEMAVLAAKVEVLLKRFKTIHGQQDERRNGSVILVVHAKGGVGCSTLAVNTAVELVATPMRRVSLIDLNLEFGNIPMLLNLHPERTLADIATTAPEELDDAEFSRFLIEDKSGLSVLAACDSPERAELVNVPLVQQTIDRLRSLFDYVVIDTPATFSQQVLASLDVAAKCVVVTAPHLAALKTTKDMIGVLEKLSYQRDRTILVVNRTSSTGLETDRVAKFFDRKPDLVVPYTPACDDAADRGRPLITLHPDSAGAKVMRELAPLIAAEGPAPGARGNLASR